MKEITRNKQYNAIIFDFNGVLLWDNHLHEEAWRRFSYHLRGVAMTDEEMKHAVHGRVNLDIFTYLLDRQVGLEELNPLIEEKEKLYRELALESIESYHLSPGAVGLLDYLKANGIPRAIATSSPWVNVAFFIEHLDLIRWFTLDHVVYDRGLYPGKPAPDIYLEAADRLGLPTSACVVAEDSQAGIRSAFDAGIGAIVAIGPREEHASLSALSGVSTVIADLNAFPRSLLQESVSLSSSL